MHSILGGIRNKIASLHKPSRNEYTLVRRDRMRCVKSQSQRQAGLRRNRRWKPSSKRPSLFAMSIVSFTSKWRSLLITIFESNVTILLALGAFSAKANNTAQESTAISLHVGDMRGEFSSLVAVG